MNLIAHVEIPVSDLGRAMRFYASVFGVAFGEVATLHGSRMAHFPSRKAVTVPAAHSPRATSTCLRYMGRSST